MARVKTIPFWLWRAWLRLRYGRVCVICGCPPWLNPVDDHQQWLGHHWEGGTRRMTTQEWAKREGIE